MIASILPDLAAALVPLASKFDAWDVMPPGIWVIFGVIGLPVYIAFLGWFLGKPRKLNITVLGSTLFLTMVSALWGGLFATTMVIRFFFFT